MPPASPENSEWLTRKKLIDPMLVAAGWRVVSWDAVKNSSLTDWPNCAIEEYPTAAGPADYALCVEGSILGVVEAKKLTVGPQGVLIQAERYSKGLANSTHNFRGYHAPFLYSTNGEVIWFHDIRNQLSMSRRVAKFHTPDALREMMGRDSAKAAEWLANNPPGHTKLRPYQKTANTETEKAIAAQKRQMLVAMATGTGKTFTLVNQCYRLLKSQTAKRILFLVDRRALAAQAVRAFSVFEPEPNQKFDKLYEVYSNRFQKEDFGEEDVFDSKVLPRDYLEKPQAKHVFVYICTIQRLAVNLFGRQAAFGGEGDEIDEDADEVDIPIHTFDVIVADECHRGYTNAELSAWRGVLDHFDAVKIGLTATPAAHTKAYFHDVVYRYTYEEAVRDGHLVDYDLVTIKSDVRINGVFLKEGETVQSIDPISGAEKLDSLEDERSFETTELERKVTSPDSNRKILLEVKKYADEHEQRYGRQPKILIFAANDLPHTSHADELCTLATDIFGRGGSYVRKITGRVDRPLQAIREFRNRPNPGIAVTVDLLSTGVDVPDIEYIVFLRPVKSRILFEQMLGRGTRKGDKFPDKSHFTVFDCFDGTLVAFFKNATTMTTEPPEKPARSIGEVIEDIWANRDRDYNIRCLAKRLQRIDKEMAPEARELFAAHGIADGDIAKFAKELAGKLKNDFTSTMQLLRKEGLQTVLQDYPRRPKTFLRAIENEDVVSSQYLIRDGLGKEHKPEDYLELFGRFVRENPAQIEAVRILLERPADWSTTALSELKQKLTAAPERFTVDVLQKAHELQYHKSLVDIISMVKHAATEQSPLLTAAERAQRAIAQVSIGRAFTPEQVKWLERIRESLVANLSIDPDDFDVMPALEGAGGWRRANQEFSGTLEELLKDINRAIAA
eukprot:TRINITY_DN138_c2_g2_i3.p1 TRINITY_DN138_c2_g2~~TRINITY_DN138_c2_g2_i3.p1  ORF type:complete len:901 (-),score=266.54 TRINITY_DN138_c2_g2_i3:4435-7137(-)